MACSSSLASDEEVCRFMFSRRLEPRYQLWVKLYATMLDKCPHSDMEAIKKAVKNGDRAEAKRIMKGLYRASNSSDLHRINTEIFIKSVDDCNFPLRKNWVLKRAIPVAQRSVNLDPNDIEKHYLLVYLLSKDAHSSQGRHLVIQKCQEALKIDKSFDEDHQDPQGPRTKISILLEYMRIESIWESLVRGPNIKMTIKNLAAYYSNRLMDESATQVVRAAWSFSKLHRSWEFWQCCCCDKKFDSSHPLLKHFLVAHLQTPQLPLEHDGNPSTSSAYVELFPPGRKEWIVPDIVSSTFTVLPRCLLQSNIETSNPAFPSRDMSITTLSYRSALSNWTDLRNSRKRLGSQLIPVLYKFLMQCDDVEASLKSLGADIDFEIKETGEWIYENEMGIVELSFRDNPFGSYDYRDVLLPLLKSYIAWLVEKKADEQASEKSDAREEKDKE